MGTDGVFMAEPVSNVIGGSLCFITMLITILPELNKNGNYIFPRIILIRFLSNMIVRFHGLRMIPSISFTCNAE